MSTHSLYFEQKCEKYQNFLSEYFPFWVVKFPIHLNRRVFVMYYIIINQRQIFSIYVCLNTLATTVNEFIINELIKLSMLLNNLALVYPVSLRLSFGKQL